MKWPADRVNAIHKAIIQRKAVESIEFQRVQLIASTFSNPNWDSEKSDRAERLRELNEHFNKAVELVYYPEGNEPEIDWDNPFYAAAKRGLEKTRAKYAVTGQMPIDNVVEISPEQVRARKESREAIDQT